MKACWTLGLAALGFAAAVAPASAQEIVERTTVIREVTTDLNHFIGQDLYGLGHADLGVVSSVNPDTGVIGVTGKHGEFALISGTMLAHDGWTLYAPGLTAGDLKEASEAQWANPAAILVHPHVIVVEPLVG